MDKIGLRNASARDYFDPANIFRKLHEIELSIADVTIDVSVRRLRTNDLKFAREGRDAAIFCIGMSEALGTKVFYAPGESADSDFTAMWFDQDTQHFCPIQLKEVAPSDLNPTSSLGEVLSKLGRYGSSTDLTVAIKFNRQGHFDPSAVKVPSGLRLAALWVFGAMTEDQSDWAIWGNFLAPPVKGVRFKYPAQLEL